MEPLPSAITLVPEKTGHMKFTTLVHPMKSLEQEMLLRHQWTIWWTSSPLMPVIAAEPLSADQSPRRHADVEAHVSPVRVDQHGTALNQAERCLVLHRCQQQHQ